jgi:fumarate hydratase class I
MAASPEFEFTELFPLGHDDTPYRLVSTEHVRPIDTPLVAKLQVDPAALTLITHEAQRDIAHFLRPPGLWRIPTTPRPATTTASWRSTC